MNPRLVALGAPVLPGHVVAGRYLVEHRIASGATAEVWRARDQVLGRGVALKVLHPHLAADPRVVARFRQEAIRAARVTHPNIVAVYDTCSEPEALVLELAEGRTLRDHLAERGPLPPRTVVEIGAAVADALDTAHRAGLVHRDVKPGNILLLDDRRVVLTDFGTATALAGHDLTEDAGVLGTARYLAPEQLTGRPVDGRADLYSLGVTMYEALCGRPPFVGDTDAAAAIARLHEEPIRPSLLRPGVPPDLERIVGKALAREPGDRYATAGALRADLLAADLTTTAPTAAPAPPPVPADASTPVGGSTAFARTERRWLIPAFALVLVALSLGVVGALVSQSEPFQRVVGRNDPEPTSTTPAPQPVRPVSVTDAVSFDPEGTGPPGENDDELGNLVDGDPETIWSTEFYGDRSLGRKSGVGVVLRLDDERTLRELEIQSRTTGWSALVFVARDEAATLEDWGRPVADRQGIDGPVTLDLRDATGRSVLVWITDLGDGRPGEFRVRIDEMTLRS